MKQIIITLLCSIFTFLIPIKGLVILITLAVAIDTALGIYVNCKKLKQPFRSHKFFNVAVKSFFYMFTILMAFLIDSFVLGGTLPILGIQHGLSKIITIVWTLNELKSMDETSQKLGNKPFWDIIKGYINKAKEIKKDLNDLTDSDKE
ncbi:phage holin family protein [Flavobacterium enshiense]|uniref:phage holin family protein n=1 Tax=Flavobacterium enshiense TaxID=1341165 RepID=UPI00345C7F07